MDRIIVNQEDIVRLITYYSGSSYSRFTDYATDIKSTESEEMERCF